MLDYMKTLMREERNMDPYAIYIYTLVINKYICFCQEHSIEIISHDSALQFFQSKILPLRYYGTQKLYCSPLKLFFQAHGVSLTLPKIHNKYRGLQHPRIMKDQEIERLMKYFSKEDKSIEPFIFHRNQLLFYIILQSAPMLSEIRTLDVNDIDLDNRWVSFKNRKIPLANETLEVAIKYLYYRAPDFYRSTPALFINKSRRGRLTNRGIEHVFKDFMNRAGVRYYTPLNVLETCLYILLKTYKNDDTKSDGINFVLTLTGKRSVDRVNNILDLMFREKGDMILPF